VDTGGNVYVTGESMRSDTNSDFATLAYSGAGVPLWTNRYNGLADGYNRGTAIAVDGGGNVFVTGESAGSSFATIKYSDMGVALWTNRYDGPGSFDGPGNDFPTALAVDSSGNVFVTGQSIDSQRSHYATVAYSAAGAPLWTNLYNGPGNTDAVPVAIAVDNRGNVFVTGGSADTTGVWGYATVAYSSAGVPLWTNRYNGPANGDGYATALGVDGSGNVFVTGASVGSSGLHDYATLAYSNQGAPLWTNRFSGGAAPYGAYARGIAVDRNGSVFVTGYSDSGSGNSDWVTIKYSSTVLPVHLDFQKLNDQLVLSWTNDGFSLQSAPVIPGTFSNIPGATSPYTNQITGSQRYFRLKRS
jgi:hypothetical protein